MGAVLGVRRAGIALAAGMSLGRSPFLRIDDRSRSRADRNSTEEMTIDELKNQSILKERKKFFKSVGNSDLAVLAATFMKWEDAASDGAGGRKRVSESLGLSFTGMREMLQLANHLDSSLSSAGYTRSKEADRNGRSMRVMQACIASALAPMQLVKIVRPKTKYAETAEGALEKDGEARGLKFFVRAGQNIVNSEPNQGTELRRDQEERVFVHPSSFLFSEGNYSVPWLVYNSLVRTSKAFLRDVTECNAYALLLFGGELEVKAAKETVVVDSYVTLSANPRIASLVGGLREKFDDLLQRKIEHPSFDLAATEEMKVIVKLVQTDGLGT